MRPFWSHLSLFVLPDLGPTPDGTFNEEKAGLEAGFFDKAETKTPRTSFAITDESFGESHDAVDRWLEQIQKAQTGQKTRYIYRKYWERQNRQGRIEL